MREGFLRTAFRQGNKKFQYATIRKGARSSEYLGSLQWIEDAGIISRCYNLTQTELPLDGNAQDDVFKVYMRDSGLFLSMLEQGTQSDVLHGNLLGYKGAIFENIIADVFSKMGRDLYYYHKESDNYSKTKTDLYRAILQKEIDIIKPACIVVMGNQRSAPAAYVVCHQGASLLNLEGRHRSGQGAFAVEGILGCTPGRIRSERLQGHSPGGEPVHSNSRTIYPAMGGYTP